MVKLINKAVQSKAFYCQNKNVSFLQLNVQDDGRVHSSGLSLLLWLSSKILTADMPLKVIDHIDK